MKAFWKKYVKWVLSTVPKNSPCYILCLWCLLDFCLVGVFALALITSTASPIIAVFRILLLIIVIFGSVSDSVAMVYRMNDNIAKGQNWFK